MPRRPAAALLVACLVALLAIGCGKSEDNGGGGTPEIGKKGDQPKAAQQLGFPTFATRNTTRVGGADAVADAAAVAQAAFPGTADVTRPSAVTLVDTKSWQDGVAASVLFALPLRAPILLTSGGDVPGSTSSALKALSPRGEPRANGAQILRVGAAADPGGYKVKLLAGNNVFSTAAAIDKLAASAAGKPASQVMVTSSERAEFAMPAAGYAAKSGVPVLFTRSKTLPPETVAAIKRHSQPSIFVLGPESAVSKSVESRLRKLGTVTRIQGPDPVVNAIAFARYTNGRFGWGVVDPGHGLIFANQRRPLDAAAAAALSGTGPYGPLLLVTDADQLPALDERYLLDIQPGYEKDPVRGVYNHGWLIGDDAAISTAVQARIDALLQIVPVDRSASEQSSSSKPKSQSKQTRTTK
jgi:putative cell wall-binding protein